MLISTRSIEYTLDGDPYLVTRQDGRVVGRSPAVQVHGSEMSASDVISTADGDYYRSDNRFDRYTPGPQPGDERHIEYTLDGDPQIVVRRGGQVVQRMEAEPCSYEGYDRVYTADGDSYRPSNPSTTNGYDP